MHCKVRTAPVFALSRIPDFGIWRIVFRVCVTSPSSRDGQAPVQPPVVAFRGPVDRPDPGRGAGPARVPVRCGRGGGRSLATRVRPRSRVSDHESTNARPGAVEPGAIHSSPRLVDDAVHAALEERLDDGGIATWVRPCTSERTKGRHWALCFLAPALPAALDLSGPPAFAGPLLGVRRVPRRSAACTCAESTWATVRNERG
jgi:hypothetical protein